MPAARASSSFPETLRASGAPGCNVRKIDFTINGF